MDEEEIEQLVEDGELEPEQVEDFENLDSDLQDLVVSGEITADEALELDS